MTYQWMLIKIIKINASKGVNCMSNILTINDVSRKLQLSKSTIYKYAEKGKIPCLKIGTSLRFFEEEINLFLQSCSQSNQINNKNNI